MDISLVVPAFNEEESINEFYTRSIIVLNSLNKNYEIIFIDDGSTDQTLDKIKSLSVKDPNIHYISLLRNSGKAVSLQKGFEMAQGEVILTMDADIQDEPEEIPKFIKKLDEGYDMVSGWKQKRNDPLEKIIPSKIFNFFLRFFSGLQLNDFNCGFKAYKNHVAKNLSIYGELHRFIPIILYFQGYKISEIPITHNERKYGKSKYGITRYFVGMMDFCTIILTVKFRTKPLHLFGGIGLIISLIGFIILLYLSCLWFFDIRSIESRPLFFLGILMFTAGIQFVTTGLLAELITQSNDKVLNSAIIKEKN